MYGPEKPDTEENSEPGETGPEKPGDEESSESDR
jgi:hypothetical protein